MRETTFTPSDRPALLQTLQRIADGTRAEHGTRAERSALLVLNLRRFREINIGYGHAVGDAVLYAVAKKIRRVLRRNDHLFHIGNDEFAVLLTELKSPQIVQLAIEKVLDTISGNHEIAGHLLPLAVVCGAAIHPDHAQDPQALLRAADMALHHAQNQNLDYALYDDSLHWRERQHATLKTDLRHALDNNELLLHYQPQIDLQSGGICGHEALMRWPHPEQGWIGPDVFIEVAEESDLIHDLTFWSLNVALREWCLLSETDKTVSVSVNLSARLLDSQEIVELVRRALNIWGAAPAALVLEITESAVMANPEKALATLNTLHDMGIVLSIDDFGTGYSSLAYLKRLPVRELKIDKSFVRHMAQNLQDRQIVQSVIDLAHNLEMRVVAEGIENDRTLTMLADMGCDYGQGYLIARPMPLPETLDWLHAQRENQPADDRLGTCSSL